MMGTEKEMRTEKEIRAEYDKIRSLADRAEFGGFVELTHKGGFWLEFLEWVLNIEEKPPKP